MNIKTVVCPALLHSCRSRTTDLDIVVEGYDKSSRFDADDTTFNDRTSLQVRVGLDARHLGVHHRLLVSQKQLWVDDVDRENLHTTASLLKTLCQPCNLLYCAPTLSDFSGGDSTCSCVAAKSCAHKIPGGPKKRGQCIFLLVSFKCLDQI